MGYNISMIKKELSAKTREKQLESIQADFEVTASQDYADLAVLNSYIDKTGLLEIIKDAAKNNDKAVYLGPRRWGKSHFLSMIYYFFDSEEKHRFRELFDDKDIAKNKHVLQHANNYKVIFFDLKNAYRKEKIDWSILWEQFIESLPRDMAEDLGVQSRDSQKIITYAEDFAANMVLGKTLNRFIKDYSHKYKFLILIDEYDSPLNKALNDHVGQKDMIVVSQNLLQELKDGFFTYLKDIKAGVIVSGVNKMAQASFFSDFNNLRELTSKINLGFSQKEMRKTYGFSDEEIVKLRQWYGGYYIHKKDVERFNPWAVVSYLSNNRDFGYYWQNTGSYDFLQYLLTQKHGIGTMEKLLERLEKAKYKDTKISFKSIYDEDSILKLLYWSGYLSYKFAEERYIIPNRDVLEMYDEIFFQESNGNEVFFTFKEAFNQAVAGLDRGDVSGYKDFVNKVIRFSYVYPDKKDVNEQSIKANIYVISKLVNSHIMQIREEVQFGGRTDFSLTYKGKKTVIEFKIARQKELDKTGKEGKEQLAKYKGDQKVLVLIDRDSWEIECDFEKNPEPDV
jgi:hypothetical protein